MQQQAAALDSRVADESALRDRLEQLRLEREQAEELAAQMARQAETLLAEKQALLRAKEHTEVERRLLAERLEYLETEAGLAAEKSESGSEGCSPERVYVTQAELVALQRQLVAMQDEREQLLQILAMQTEPSGSLSHEIFRTPKTLSFGHL